VNSQQLHNVPQATCDQNRSHSSFKISPMLHVTCVEAWPMSRPPDAEPGWCSMFVLQSCKGFNPSSFHMWCCTRRQCNLQYTQQALEDLGYQVKEDMKFLTCYETLGQHTEAAPCRSIMRNGTAVRSRFHCSETYDAPPSGAGGTRDRRTAPITTSDTPTSGPGTPPDSRKSPMQTSDNPLSSAPDSRSPSPAPLVAASSATWLHPAAILEVLASLALAADVLFGLGHGVA
jgi:hypothetical protein